MWECMGNHIAFHLVQFFKWWRFLWKWILKDWFFLKKKRKENWGLLFTSPLKDETFQAVAVQQRPRTKSVMHVQIKLLFCSFKPFVVHGLFCRHCICLSSLLFKGLPTTSVLRVVQRNTLTAYRKTFHTVLRAIEWPQNSYRTSSWSL